MGVLLNLVSINTMTHLRMVKKMEYMPGVEILKRHKTRLKM